MRLLCQPGSKPIGGNDPQMESIMLKCVYCRMLISPPTPTATKSQYLTHLRVAHKDVRPTESQINDLAELHDIHICPTCPLIQPYSTKKGLEKHITARHLITRTRTNLEIVTDTYTEVPTKIHGNKPSTSSITSISNHHPSDPPSTATYNHLQKQKYLTLTTTSTNGFF